MGNEMKEEAKTSLQKQQPAKMGTLAMIKGLISNDSLKKRFEDVLGKSAPQFLASITSLVSSSTNFNDVDPNTIIASAMIAATLNLPINPQLAYAYIIPYAGKATFQMGWKGYKQLAIRTGLYAFINSTDVREGELKARNRLTGQVIIEFDATDEIREAKKVIGYANYFKLLTGYESTLYMSIDELLGHAKKYSKLYQYDLKKGKKDSKWSIESELPFMCLKTVTKLNLSNNGILSVEMQKAKISDDAVLNEEGEVVEYPDSAEIKTESSSKIDPSFEVEQWETPAWIIEQIQKTQSMEELSNLISEHSSQIECIGGKEGELIQKVKEDQAKKLSK